MYVTEEGKVKLKEAGPRFEMQPYEVRAKDANNLAILFLYVCMYICIYMYVCMCMNVCMYILYVFTVCMYILYVLCVLVTFSVSIG